jgi:probable O-glycosylation ligase (exosortase A-associated)
MTIFLIYKREHIQALIWVIVCSLGFYAFKGGIFILRTGGQNRVFGPPGSFIEENNALALALIMTLPLMWYLYIELNERWKKNAMLFVMAMTGMAILGSHSRGAALAGGCMLLFLIFKSKHKLAAGVVLVLFVSVGLSLMPQKWFDRMGTVTTYQEDNSAMGRLTAWEFATQLAIKKPTGGGFGALVEQNYRRYSPEISRRIDERDGRFQGAHSIYFRVLGEHGFLGLVLFLALGASTYRRARNVQRAVLNRRDLAWAGNLCTMLQVSLVGYAVGGAFLGLSYFDLYYHLIALTIIVHSIVLTGDKVLPEPMAQSK